MPGRKYASLAIPPSGAELWEEPPSLEEDSTTLPLAAVFLVSNAAMAIIPVGAATSRMESIDGRESPLGDKPLLGVATPSISSSVSESASDGSSRAEMSNLGRPSPPMRAAVCVVERSRYARTSRYLLRSSSESGSRAGTRVSGVGIVGPGLTWLRTLSIIAFFSRICCCRTTRMLCRFEHLSTTTAAKVQANLPWGTRLASGEMALVVPGRTARANVVSRVCERALHLCAVSSAQRVNQEI